MLSGTAMVICNVSFIPYRVEGNGLTVINGYIILLNNGNDTSLIVSQVLQSSVTDVIMNITFYCRLLGEFV